MPAYRGSWYSQLPSFGWFDPEDRPGSNALGVPDEQQGIALPTRSTLGKWFNVTSPGGQTLRLQHTDIGPAAWTGRGVDISAAAANRFGYTPKTFPTDASFTVEPADGVGGPMPPMPDASQGQRKMPGSLYDMLTAPPQYQSNEGGLFGGGRSGSLIGLGMGLLQPYRPWAGESPFVNALRGYQTGAASDESAAQNAWKRQMAERQFQFEKQKFDITDAQKAMRDVLGPNPSPEDKNKFMRDYYFAKVEGDWKPGSIKDPTTETEHPYAWNQRTNEYRWGPNGPPPSLGATAGGAVGGAATPGPSSPVWTQGGGGVGYGAAGVGPQGFGTGTATTQPSAIAPSVAPAAAAPGALGTPQLPPWVQTMPPSVRKEAQKEAAKEAVKMQTTQAAQEPAAKAGAQNVLRSIDDAQRLASNPGGLLPTTGIVGGALKNVYQPSKDLDATLNTIKAGASLDRLQQMRANSPSGASGLGQVTEREHVLLQNSIAALDQSQSQAQFLANLQHVKNTYSWILNRTNPNEPPPPPPATAQNPPTSASTRTGAAAVPTAPQRPSNVPAGSAYSPSRNQWRAPTGQTFDADGKPL